MFFHTAIIARQLFLDFGEKISMSLLQFEVTWDLW